MTLRYTAHMQVYTFTANNKGQINHRSKTKNVFWTRWPGSAAAGSCGRPCRRG